MSAPVLKHKLYRLIADGDAQFSIARYLRQRRGRRLQQFLEQFKRPLTVLDVGGTYEFWRSSGLTPLSEISVVLLNLEATPVNEPGFSAISGDGADLSRFADRSFDVVFSNSVLEHVGSWQRQELMAKEIERVGKAHFIQTPARYFPLEPHFLFPFFWFLPERLRVKLACTIPLGWYPRLKHPAEAREFLTNFLLLTRAQFKTLFPRSRIESERVLGIVKSYIAISSGESEKSS